MKATVIPPAATAVFVPGRRPNPTQAATAPRPAATASTTSARRRMRSKTTPSRVSAATQAAAAKAICMMATSPTASGYAEQDERECHADSCCGERPERPLRFGREGLSVDGNRGAVDQLDAARSLSRTASNQAHRRGQAPLRVAEEGGERGGEHSLDANGLGGGEVGREHRKGPPGQREPRIAVKAPPEELEVVSHRDERPGRDEREQPETGSYRDNYADHAGAGERDEGRVTDARLERPSVQLIESVCRDAHAEKEREETEAEHAVLELRC